MSRPNQRASGPSTRRQATLLKVPATRQCQYRVVFPTSRLLRAVHESNRQGRDGWDRFAPHRERVQALLAGCATDGSSLCVLGPGNLNDVRLDELLDRFAEVHLVDIDVAAVRFGVARQAVAGRGGCVLHEPTDLTGVLDLLAAGTGAGLVARLSGLRCTVAGGPFDVTVSTGVLTQLLQSVVDSPLPREDVVPVSLALRDKHLRDLVGLTRPGGAVVLVTDVVSTATAPRLQQVDAADLEPEMASLVAAGNFFTGANPYRIVALFEEHPRLRRQVTDVRLVDPWMWAVTPDREHLTCAIVARRVERWHRQPTLNLSRALR